MKISYKYNDQILQMNEALNGDDVEFFITLLDVQFKQRLQKVQAYFEENKVLTDLFVYPHQNNRYQIIVKKDFYNEFLIQLFKQQLLDEIKWITAAN
ncbi:hypothetical protein [Bacillus sp. JJ1764]|uniref:hypothetical protein n=1 Tax=Bacillus sp. JJ1764 TaxID=3122964 RepID=UPI002FFDBED7